MQMPAEANRKGARRRDGKTEKRHIVTEKSRTVIELAGILR